MDGIASAEHASDLGVWRTSLWTPAANDPLAAHLATIWYFDGALTLARERHFPNGRYEIVVQFDAPHRPVDEGRSGAPFPTACVGGMETASTVIEAPAGCIRVLGVRLTPLGASAVLDVPPSHVAGTTIDLGDAAGRAARDLEGRLHDARTGAARVAIALAWTRARLARSASRVDGPVERAFLAIDRGTLRVGPVAAASGVERSAFTRRFREQIGVTPKRFAGVVRVRAALGWIARGERDLARIATDAGYYDQAHFANDMRRATGFSPRDLVRAERYPSGESVIER